jgi:hypothetical protein
MNAAKSTYTARPPFESNYKRKNEISSQLELLQNGRSRSEGTEGYGQAGGMACGDRNQIGTVWPSRLGSLGGRDAAAEKSRRTKVNGSRSETEWSKSANVAETVSDSEAQIERLW